MNQGGALHLDGFRRAVDAALQVACAGSVGELRVQRRPFQLDGRCDGVVVRCSIACEAVRGQAGLVQACRFALPSLQRYRSTVLVDDRGGVLHFHCRLHAPAMPSVLQVLEDMLNQIEVWIAVFSGESRHPIVSAGGLVSSWQRSA